MFKAVGIVALAVLILGGLGAGIFFYNSAGMTQKASEVINARNMPFFPPAAQTISLNQELIERLGGTMTFGEVKVKSGDGNDETGGWLMLDVEVSGPKASGHAQVKVAKAGPRAPWQSKGGDFFASSGPPVHLQAR